VKSSRKFLFVALLLVAGCSPTRGCVESSFDLAPESRLPVWFKLPPGMKRFDVNVTMDYWGGLSPRRSASLTMRKRGFLGLIVAMDSIVAELVGNEPQTIPPHGPAGRIPYPSYEVLTARGLVEIVEHRKMEPIFYVNDDPEVRRHLQLK
jgi:hypothetical protein